MVILGIWSIGGAYTAVSSTRYIWQGGGLQWRTILGIYEARKGPTMGRNTGFMGQGGGPTAGSNQTRGVISGVGRIQWGAILGIWGDGRAYTTRVYCVIIIREQKTNQFY